MNRSASLLAILAVFLSLGGCSRKSIAQVKPVAVYPTEAEEVGQEEQVEFVPATVGFAEGKAQEEPKDIIAAQIRSQGYACNSTQSAEREAEASADNQRGKTIGPRRKFRSHQKQAEGELMVTPRVFFEAAKAPLAQAILPPLQ